MGAKVDRWCPFCEEYFDSEEWESGECPRCHNEFTLWESCTEDYSECWEETEWDWGKLTREKHDKR